MCLPDCRCGRGYLQIDRARGRGSELLLEEAPLDRTCEACAARSNSIWHCRTHGPGLVLAAKRATAAIPIVFAAAGDPVGTGLVVSLAHPGGNITGLSIQQTDVAAKRLQLLHEVVPGVSRLAILGNVRSPAVLLDMREVQAAARTYGMEVVSVELRREDEIEPLLETLQGRAEALYVVNDPLVDSNRDRINATALAGHLPTMYGSREHAEAGGLMSYGADFADMFRRAAVLVDKILKGAAPAALPAEQPTKFELVLNLKQPSHSASRSRPRYSPAPTR